MPRFRFSAAAYNDQDPIEITVKIKFIIHEILPVGHPTGTYFIVGHPDGVSSGYIDYEHTFNTNPLIAWNKLHMTGSRYTDSGERYIVPWSNPPRPAELNELIFPAPFEVTWQELINVGHLIFDYSEDLLETFSTIGDRYEAGKAEMLLEIPESTAFIGFTHGMVDGLIDGKLKSVGGGEKVYFSNGQSDSWQSTKVSDLDFPPYWFAFNVSCGTLPTDEEEHLTSKAALAYGIIEEDSAYVGYDRPLLGVGFDDLDSDGLIFEKIPLSDHVNAIYTWMTLFDMSIGEAVKVVNVTKGKQAYADYGTPMPAHVVGDPDIRYPWVLFSKDDMTKAEALQVGTLRLWVPLDINNEIDWDALK